VSWLCSTTFTATSLPAHLQDQDIEFEVASIVLQRADGWPRHPLHALHAFCALLYMHTSYATADSVSHEVHYATLQTGIHACTVHTSFFYEQGMLLIVY
jgi:hypothetical protein